MITKSQYFGTKSYPPMHGENADKLLSAVNALLHDVAELGAYSYWIDADTNSQISGSKGGAGDGGYRSPDSVTGAPKSSHREARGVDVFDPDGKLDAAITRKLLIKYNLYREHPDSTIGWCHLTDRAPGSGCRTFLP
jgi:hypothetical protein